MASSWPPKKNAAFTLVFDIRDANNDLVVGATGLDSEISKDGGAFADCTNEAAQIGSSGHYSLVLTSTEMNCDYAIVQIKSSGKTVSRFFYTTESTWDEGIDTKAVLSAAIAASSFAADAIDANAVASDLLPELFGFQLPDSIPADGTRPTVAQALYMLIQMATEMAITGTTMTIKKVDGSTTLFTLTLNHATNPSSRTRET